MSDCRWIELLERQVAILCLKLVVAEGDVARYSERLEAARKTAISSREELNGALEQLENERGQL